MPNANAPHENKPQNDSKPAASEIRDFFSESDSLHITQRWWFISILAISVALWIVYLFLLLGPYFRLLATDYPTAVATAINSIASAFVAALISILIVILVNHANIRRLNSIKQLVPRADILENLFQILNGYDQRYASDKHIVLTFGELLEAPDGFLAARVKLEVTESVKLNGSRLVFEFQTLNRDLKDDSTVEIPLLGREGADEMISVDSTDIDRHFKANHEDLFKGLVHLAVNSETKKITPESLEKVGTLHRWVFDVSQELTKRDLLNVYYVYEYTHEIPGYAFFEAREPTFGLYCKADYRQLVKRMSCYFVETFHSTTHRHDITDNKGEIVISSQEWVFPRSAATFCWYKHQSTDTQIAEAASAKQTDTPANPSAGSPVPPPANPAAGIPPASNS